MSENYLDIFKNYTVNKNISYPLYHQFKDIILQMLENGDLKPGEMIPPEIDLCIVYDISRTTIRQAFNELVDCGKFVRIKGRGTFVAQDIIKHQQLDFIRTFKQTLSVQHFEPGIILNYKKFTEVDELVSNQIKINSTLKIATYSYTLTANGTPICHVESYYPIMSLAEFNMPDIDLLSDNPRTVAEETIQSRVYRTESRLSAELPLKSDLELFDISKNVAILTYDFYAHNRFDQVIEYTTARFRGDMNMFSFINYFDNALIKK